MALFVGVMDDEGEHILGDEENAQDEESDENNFLFEGAQQDVSRRSKPFAAFLLQLIAPFFALPFGRFGNKLVSTLEEEQKLAKQAKSKPQVYIQGPKVYSCADCRTHLATDDEVMSRAFQGRGGRAFLFDRVVNVATGPPEDRLLITGLHTVADLMCHRCKTVIGWKYERAYDESQRYKEGRYIIEKCHLYRENWE